VLVATLGEKVVPQLAAGGLTVPVLATFPLGEATAAYRRFTAGGKVGKIVLTG
jgi:NADPH:quinone reductase-like Zn-dependent oxidoreductase